MESERSAAMKVQRVLDVAIAGAALAFLLFMVSAIPHG
jgi:hypothetical protein